MIWDHLTLFDDGSFVLHGKYPGMRHAPYVCRGIVDEDGTWMVLTTLL